MDQMLRRVQHDMQSLDPFNSCPFIMKKVYLAIALASILLLAGCGNAPTALPATTDSTFSLGQTYTI